MKKLLYLILPIILVISCKNEENNSSDVPQSTQQKKIKVKVPEQETIPVENGPYVEKYPSGVVKLQGEMQNGKKSGEWKAFFPSGIKQSEAFYTNGVLNGKSAIFYDNGHLRMAGYYDNGLRDGVWRLYKKDGSFDKEIVYKNGTEVEK